MKQIKITDISGVKIGHAQDEEAATGCTAVIFENGAVAGVDVRGAAPATRETDLLRSVNMVEKINAVMLSGGSAYGLSAADGAMKFLEERKMGFNVGVGVVPIVCGASLFDLVLGKADVRPDSKMGYEACENAFKSEPLSGNVGAGTGATIGKCAGVTRMMKGGIGTYALEVGDVKVGAIVALNALGDIFDYDTNEQIGGLLSSDRKSFSSTAELMYSSLTAESKAFTGNTTITCLITNAKLDKTQCNKLASIAHNGYALAIRPVHTSADGDAIFAVSVGEVEANPDAIGSLAVEVIARAINNAVRSAESAYGLPCSNEILKGI